VVEARSVWSDEFSRSEGVAGLDACLTPFAGRIVAEVRDDLILLVQQRDLRAQVRNYDIAVLIKPEVTGQGCAGDEVDMLAIQREPLQTIREIAN
jgi:hypothetical protein